MQVTISAIFKNLYEKNCSIILYITTDDKLEDHTSFFKNLGNNVVILNIEELDQYEKEKY